MTKPEYPLDRSAAFSALLELSPEFGKTDLNTSGQLITEFLDSWRTSDSKDMFAHAREWLGANPIGQQPGASAPSTPGAAHRSRAADLPPAACRCGLPTCRSGWPDPSAQAARDEAAYFGQDYDAEADAGR
jgi:hypothetical protein